ncbi:polymorphic toxin type 44 domain-containing protein [Ewingella sp. AOP9-I1-14]
MTQGYYLVVEDETTCGGIIIEGDTTHTLFGRAVAREEDRVTCGKHPGTYFIIGHIPGDKIHGRNFAGTLHSKSSCPCEAEFIPSMVDDTYDLTPSDSSKPSTQASESADNNNQANSPKNKIICTHTDGALIVAEYIVNEIKKNVRSQTAEQIRLLIDKETYNESMKEWEYSPWYNKLNPPPQLSPVTAMAIWFQAVKTGSIWDHKHLIKSKFSEVAVERQLKSRQISKSHYHKYKNHDYFYVVWSNIHYGYVGLSTGFSVETLLAGSNMEQIRTSIDSVKDPIDDIACVNIGFNLYYKYGRYARDLTSIDILNALENEPDINLKQSRQDHLCLSVKKPNYTV